MKTNKAFIILMLFFFGIINCQAQNAEILPGGLTLEQRSLIKEQQELIATNREKFKASLTAQQLAILKNTSIDLKSQQKALISSLSKEQKQFLADNIQKAKILKEEFKNTLTNDQRQQIKLMNEKRNRENIQESRRRLFQRNK